MLPCCYFTHYMTLITEGLYLLWEVSRYVNNKSEWPSCSFQGLRVSFPKQCTGRLILNVYICTKAKNGLHRQIIILVKPYVHTLASNFLSINCGVAGNVCTRISLACRPFSAKNMQWKSHHSFLMVMSLLTNGTLQYVVTWQREVREWQIKMFVGEI